MYGTTVMIDPASARTLPYEPRPAFAPHAHSAAEADCKGKRIGILIVAYNAVGTLSGVLKRIPPTVWANVEEVAVFDDASQDATYELAVGIRTLADVPKLTVLRHGRNLGYGGNQKAGYKYFIDKGFDIVVLLHGDGQYAPEILSHLYKPIVEGKAEAVFGSRMMKDYGGPIKGGMPFYKWIGNRILTTFENKALGLQLTEFHSGYRAYDLHALARIDPNRMTDNFHFDTEIIIKLHHQGFRIGEVPIPTYYGSEICYVDGLKYARDVFAAVRRYRRTSAGIREFPEFSEYFVHYPIKDSAGSSHRIASKMTGSGRNVLDVGCGRGFFAERLTAAGNKVDGVDSLPPSAGISTSIRKYVQADLDGGLAGVVESMGSRTYDCVLLLDVLEHLRHPESILRDLKGALRGHGCVVVSVPNVANIAIRLSLLLGRFDYTDRGILDRTHVRFYTRRTARAMVESCGYRVLEEAESVIPLELALGVSPENPAMKALNWLLRGVTRLLPGLFGYQIMYKLVPSGATDSEPA